MTRPEHPVVFEADRPVVLSAPWVTVVVDVDRVCVNNAWRELTIDEVLRQAGVR